MAHCWQPQTSFANPNWVQGSQSCWPSSTFRDLMHAFPRPKHSTGRVTKPRSAGNSPSSGGRRRTATIPHGPSTYQGYQAPVNAALLASALSGAGRARPTSWHPSLEPVQYPTAQYLPATTALDNFAAIGVCPQPLPTAAATFQDGPVLPSYASDIPCSDMGLHPLAAVQQQMPLQQSFLHMNDSHVEPVSWDTNASTLPAMAEPMSDCWSFDMSSMHNSIPPAYVGGSGYESVPSSGSLTQPPTPDFLPIQHPEDDLIAPLPEKHNAEDELVGMGLYSNPEASLGSSLLGLSGKGLKLEETFTPSADETEEKDDDDEDEDDDDESEQDESPVQNNGFPAHQRQPGQQKTYPQPMKAPASMMQRSFFFEDDDLEQHVVAEPQPFINMASQPCMNYGYGWI
ncbi:hypothetical protein BO70DRAFT_366390 [Aspergillus heteromorphus CBS 117.55]|uniref:Uncharacterized protein n=1 Tax=Aspergillus heteromorphus CBS 117.55 TaxID=1448321 RepID=A0A317V323_9EURO|nr:uncharacterized protein BO70DRAFT_366390 [Aspergillus heteromorphus CBS 117.55]PWY67202.1 hypothetical protein BO70DRAFT_366390 [Aspergillus heteromorphus CBS 117.55]